MYSTGEKVHHDNNYEKDHEWSSERSWDFEDFYKEIFDNHVRVPDDTDLQINGHVDLLVSKDKTTMYLEEKNVRNDWDNLYFEVFSNTAKHGAPTSGWYCHKYPAKVSVLLHWVFPSSHIILDWKATKKWAKSFIDQGIWKRHTMPDKNKSSGFLVPIRDIPDNCWFIKDGEGSKKAWQKSRIPSNVNIIEYPIRDRPVPYDESIEGTV